MSYIGNEPVNGNFSVADAITTSSTATYALTVGSVAFTPESVNHCIVSLNGVVQAPTNAYTISGSNIVFASALTSSDVIDFIYFLGHVNDIGTVSDGTVSLAKMAVNSIDSDQYVDGSIDLAHMSSESVDEDNLHISNAGTNGQYLQKQSGNSGGMTWADAGGDWVKLHGSTLSTTPANVDIDTVFSASYKVYKLFIVDYDVSTDGLIRVPFLVSGTVQTAADYYIKYNDMRSNFSTFTTGGGVTTDTEGFEINQGWYTNSDSDIKSSMEVTFYNPNDNSRHNSIQFNSILIQSGHWGATEGVGFYNANIAATGLRVVPSAGTLATGSSFYLYGLKV